MTTSIQQTTCINAIQTNSISIVASDLDGTLLAPNHQISSATKTVLTELSEKGFTFIFATGRHHIDVASIREVAGIPGYMITSNGARIHDLNDQLIYSQNVEPSIVQPIIDLVKQDKSIRVNLYQGDCWFINQEDEMLKAFHQDSKFPYSLFDVNKAPTNDIAKIFFVYPDHDYLTQYQNMIVKQFGEQVNAVFSTPHCLEVMDSKVSKGSALEAVAKSLQLSLDNCIAFGDGMNDVEMLSKVSKGLIMENAHIKVKQALPECEVIGTNSDDAVANYLRANLL